ncbi:hypothetical protein HU755_21695 [Pseudomonas sp. SWRI111]|uniref:hypothetical protein n=1 Tax=Pseudomonas sp. SWRI111 TaxID=2745507 RepID=UPI001647C59B|nr:hypothetical protein [Pseudomonas sp. SWRI111]MBC3209422.1 hypothetical protein [Pseudomonas sp. SWRI111]
MNNGAPKYVFTSSGQCIVRSAHSSDALHILAMPDTSDNAAVGKQLLTQMVKRPVSDKFFFKKFGQLPLMIDAFNHHDLRSIIRAAWEQAGFIPPTTEDYSLESFGAAALKHYRAAESTWTKKHLNTTSLHGQDLIASANYANALVDLKRISDRVDSTAKALTATDASSALKDLVSLQSEMSGGFARLHQVIIEEIVPGWLKQSEEAGRAAAKSIMLAAVGLVVTIGVSIVVAVMQMRADNAGGVESSRQQEVMISLLKQQLSEEKEMRNELTLQMNLYRTDHREAIEQLVEKIKSLPRPIVKMSSGVSRTESQ